MSDTQERTEQPTNYRIEQAQKQGFINYSSEFNSFLSLISGIVISYFYGNQIISVILNTIIFNLRFNHFIIQNNHFFGNFIFFLKDIILFLFYFFFYTIFCLY